MSKINFKLTVPHSTSVYVMPDPLVNPTRLSTLPGLELLSVNQAQCYIVYRGPVVIGQGHSRRGKCFCNFQGSCGFFQFGVRHCICDQIDDCLT